MLLAIDEGTTGVTALVLDADGRIRGRGYREITQHFPQPGCVEHDAAEIWRLTREAAAEAMAPGAGGRGGGAGDHQPARDGRALGPRDGRAAAPRARLAGRPHRRTAAARSSSAGHEPEVRERSGLVLDPYFSATKLAWLLDNVPDARRRAEAGELAAGTIDSWLVWKLTGGRAAPHRPHQRLAHAALQPAHAATGIAALLRALRRAARGAPRDPPSSERGIRHHRGAAAGFDGLPIAGIAGDQQAALFGQGCWAPGQAKNTYGTGAFLLLHTGDEPVSPAARAADHGWRAARAASGSTRWRARIFIAGAAVQWLRDGLGVVASAAEIGGARAFAGEQRRACYFVPAFTGLGRAALGAAGARHAGRAHARHRPCPPRARRAGGDGLRAPATWRSAMGADSGVPLRELRVDGGAAANDWLMQFQADLLGVPLRALGAGGDDRAGRGGAGGAGARGVGLAGGVPRRARGADALRPRPHRRCGARGGAARLAARAGRRARLGRVPRGGAVNSCLLLACLALAAPSHGTAREAPPPARDRWFAEDKLKHFVASFIVTSLAGSGARAAGLEHGASLAVGAGVGMAVGVLKEARDLSDPRATASLRDLAWDAAGVGAAVAVLAQTR